MERPKTNIRKKIVPFAQGTVFDISVISKDNGLTYLRFVEDESEDGRGIEIAPEELRPIAHALLEIAEELENDPASEIYKTVSLHPNITFKKA